MPASASVESSGTKPVVSTTSSFTTEKTTSIECSETKPVVSTTESSFTTEKTTDVDPPVKDGGLQAWCSVVGGVLIFASTMGYTNAFGVYQDHYTRNGGISASGASWIGSVQLFLLVALGFPAGQLVDAGYFRVTIFVGSVVYICSLLAASFTDPHRYYQLFLSQGIGMGVGAGLLYVPAAAIQGRHWKRFRPMAVGIVMLGVGLGGIIFPIVFNRLLVTSSFPRAVRSSVYIIIGFLGAANLLMSSPKRSHRPHSPTSALVAILKDPAYYFLTFGVLLILAGLFFPYFYLQLFSILHGVDSNLAFYSLVVMNAASIPGRLIPNLFVHKFGVFNLIIPSTALCGLLVFALFGVRSAGGMFAFAVVYGVCSGAWVSLIILAFASTARHDSEIGVRMGFGYGVGALGALVGNPIDGALLGQTNIWVRPIVFTSVILLGGTCFLLVARYLIAGKKGTPYV